MSVLRVDNQLYGRLISFTLISLHWCDDQGTFLPVSPGVVTACPLHSRPECPLVSSWPQP